ncbi:hypothetical protein ScPMuIL_012616 [Solemya velum]
MEADVPHEKHGKSKRAKSALSIQSTASSTSEKADRHHKTTKKTSSASKSKNTKTPTKPERSIKRSQETNTGLLCENSIPTKSDKNGKSRKIKSKKGDEKDTQRESKGGSLGAKSNVESHSSGNDSSKSSSHAERRASRDSDQSEDKISDTTKLQDTVSKDGTRQHKQRPKVRRSISADVSSIQRKYRQLSQKHNQSNVSNDQTDSEQPPECWNGEPEFQARDGSRKKSESDQNLHTMQKNIGFSGREDVFIDPVNCRTTGDHDDSALYQQYDRGQAFKINFAGYNAATPEDDDFLSVGYCRHGLKHSFPKDQSGKKLHPRFIQKVVRSSSGYKWVLDPNFQVKNHIFSMPSTIETMEDLQEYISEMASRSLMLDHPLWEIQILSNFGDQRDMVLLVRMHPCFCDGVSFVKLLYKTVADKETVTSVQPQFSLKGSLFSKAKAFFYGPLLFFSKCLCVRRDFNLLHGNHVHLSGKRVISWSEPYNLEAVTRIKQVTRSTLNDVLMSVAAGNMRNYLQLNGISNPYDMQCCLPILFKSNKSKGINYIMVNVNIPTNTEGSIPRLWQMKQTMENLQTSALHSVKRGALLLTQCILPECLSAKLWGMIYSKSTVLISNLPGPETSLYLASKKMKALMFWMPPIHQMAVAISFFTYGDQIRMAVVSDRSVMPNPELLTKDFIFQMDQLSELLANRRIPGEHLAKRLEAVQIDNEIHMEQTVEQIQVKMALVQQELHLLKIQLDTEKPGKHAGADTKLMKKIEQLKEQFRELLVDMRKKKASETENAMILSDEEHEEDDMRESEEPRRPFRRRAMSTSSKMSTLSVSSTMRPLAANELFSAEPEMFIDSLEKQNYRYPRERMASPTHTVRPAQQRLTTMDEFEILEYPYSPSVERRYRTY